MFFCYALKPYIHILSNHFKHFKKDLFETTVRERTKNIIAEYLPYIKYAYNNIYELSEYTNLPYNRIFKPI